MNKQAATPAPHRQHPLAILRFTFRYIYLLLIPLFRGVPYFFIDTEVYRWIRGAWIDLIAIFLLLFLPFLFWLFYSYSMDEENIVLRRGILIRRTATIPRHHISTLLVERPWYLRIFGAVRLAIDTDAGNRRVADFRLTVSQKRATEILSQQTDTAQSQYRYHPSWKRVGLLTIFTSNSLSGVLLLAVTFRQIGVILGEEFSRRLIGDIEAVANNITWIPRTAALLALLLLAGWCVAALGNLLRHTPLKAVRSAHVLRIHTGCVVQREYACTVRSINYVDIRQSLLSRLLGLHMVFINCIGYGKVKNTMSILIPASRRKRVIYELRKLLPEFASQSHTLDILPTSVLRYIASPLLWMLFVYPVVQLTRSLSPFWTDLIQHLAIMTYIPLLWILAIRLFSFFSAGCSINRRMVTLCSHQGFSLHTYLLPISKVVAWQVRQSPIQRLTGGCDLRIFTYNEYRTPITLRGLRYQDAESLLQQLPTISKDD